VPNTIVNAFQIQHSNKEKAKVKTDSHVDTRHRIVQYLAPPTAFHDHLRSMPVDQLNLLPDPELVHQALQLLTVEGLCVYLIVRLF
jgi:hypothetical protein